VSKRQHKAWLHLVRHLIEITSLRQETQHTLRDWLQVENDIEKPSNKLLFATELDSDIWVGAVLVGGDLVAEAKLVSAQRFQAGVRTQK
jgi:hypothetical protein